MKTSGREASTRLVRKLERVLARGHPWIWREALEDRALTAGTVVTVLDRGGRFLARGIADEGPIGVRVLSLDPRERVGAELFAARLREAAALRDRVVPPHTDTYRLVHGEGDRLPGVVCDVYGATAVLRLDGAGIAAWRATLHETLEPVLASRGVTTLLEKSGRRGKSAVSAVYGALPPAPVEVREHGVVLLADLLHGQKTGLFLDHRETRRRVRELARGARVLNLYGYTGASSAAAGLGGASRVDTVDVAAPALALAEQIWTSNDLPAERHAVSCADVPAFLREARERGRSWDLVLADPPSFAPKESALESALASYLRLHVGALAVLRRGGLYLAASCSSHVRREAFAETVAEAAARTGRSLQLLESWHAPADHPRLPAFVEGDYLEVMLYCAG